MPDDQREREALIQRVRRELADAEAGAVDAEIVLMEVELLSETGHVFRNGTQKPPES